MLKYFLKVVPFWFLNLYRKKLMSNYGYLYKKMLSFDPEIIDSLSEIYAIHAFKRCSGRVPAYQDFIKKNKINKKAISIKILNNLPPTTKKNYILTSKKYSSLCLDGDINKINFWVKSSGHSNKEREWGKSNKEIDFSSTILAVGLDFNFNISNNTTLIINGFILSSWVTGISFALMAHKRNSIINVGPNEKEILEVINTLGREYKQIIILGYPPFIKNLVDYFNLKNFKWKKHNIHFFIGGEFFPEEWRDYISANTKTVKTKIISGYGSSDLGIIGGIETKESILIRNFAKKNKKLKEELFGSSTVLPMLFQYPPFNYISSNENKELKFTSILPETAMPLINYNLNDKGGVIRYNEMKEILKKHNINIDIKLKLPFLFVEGRSTGAVKLFAFMIYPENIKECIYRSKELSETTTGKFKLKIEYDNKENERIIIDFELSKNIKKSIQLSKIYSKSINKNLRKINGGYDTVCKNFPNSSRIYINLYKNGEFPHDYKSKYKYT